MAEELSPFWLKAAFPDAQGIFDAKHSAINEIKDNCFVAIDANVLLLPYKLENVSLDDVVLVYKKLTNEKRLIIPAQAAREFAKHRSEKVGEVVKYLRDEASLLKTVLKKKIGALTGNKGYDLAKAKVDALAGPIKEARVAINAVADEVAANVGEDPVSIAYRELFSGVVVEDPDDCNDREEFIRELRARYAVRRPPGYKDGAKDDEGAGDLILWKTVLAEGVRRKSDCILVTGEEKPDWHVQLNGPFQPRLELIEEYREATSKTLHVIPLSQLLKLFSASQSAVENVRLAEAAESAKDRRERFLRKEEYIRDVALDGSYITDNTVISPSVKQLFYRMKIDELTKDLLKNDLESIRAQEIMAEIDSLRRHSAKIVRERYEALEK